MTKRRPRVLIAVRHPAMRRLIPEFLDRGDCWETIVGDVLDAPEVAADLVIIDSSDLPRFFADPLRGFPRHRLVVIGPEPEAAYMAAAARYGAGGWVAREAVAECLDAEMVRALRTGPQPSSVVQPDGAIRAGADH